jgi:predicted nucleotide-binding protein (sugar kinase/HSP70/actin superfamily)
MPSESVCYPAKLAHGHIVSLINQGIKTIFYPCIAYSRKEFDEADNKYNCPIVASYSEVIRNNVEELKDVKYINPFLPFEPKKLAEVVMELDEFKEYNFKKSEVLKAAKAAEEEYQRYRDDVHKKGQEIVDYIKENNLRGIVLA